MIQRIIPTTQYGLAIYSNSKHMALSYVSILEFLWKQLEVAEQLKLHDRMKSEFINMATMSCRHLSTDVSWREWVVRKATLNNMKNSISIISRNARRLKFLAKIYFRCIKD